MITKLIQCEKGRAKTNSVEILASTNSNSESFTDRKNGGKE